MLRMWLLRSVRCFHGLSPSWVLLVGSSCQLGHTLLKRLMSLLLLLVLFVLLLSGLSGLVKCHLAETQVILNLLDLLVRLDPVVHIVWSRFRLMRKAFDVSAAGDSSCLSDVAFDCSWRPGHGSVHLLLVSAAETGLVWDGEQHRWIRAALPPLRIIAGAYAALSERYLWGLATQS